ncbi:MAG: MCE family protein [Brucellaceae bacterium]|nr:MCE family protein [Brucellaceae bacterium]
METRANYIAVGIFTLLVMLAAFAFVYWTSRIGGTGETATIIVRIPGSAAGLGRGSPVLFNGVRIGDVRRVYFQREEPGVAFADTSVIKSAPITVTTRASIGIQSLAGLPYIEFSGGSPSEPSIIVVAEEQGTVATITADPSAVTNIIDTVESIAERADKILGDLEVVVSAARDPLKDTVANIERFSEALSKNSDGIDAFLNNFTQLAEQLGSASGKLGQTLDSANELIVAVDRDKINETIENIRSFTKRVDDASGNLDTIVANVDTTVKSISEFANTAGKTVDKLDSLIADIEPGTINKAVDDIASASQSVREAADEAAKVAKSVGERSEDIDKTIANARELTEKLNAASSRIDGMLAKVDSLLGQEGGGDLIAEARKTLDAYRNVAANLDARISRISTGLESFSGRGLDQVEDFVRESQRAIQRIEQAITELQRNPQRIISGGEGTVRQFDGRARR